MKMIVIAGKSGEQIDDLMNAATDAGVVMNYTDIRDISFINTGETFACFTGDGTPLDSYDVAILRGGYGPFKNEVCMAASFMMGRGVTVLDPSIGQRYIAGKMYESLILAAAGLPHLRTVQILDDRHKEYVAAEIGFPCIAKPISGSKGRGVTLVSHRAALDAFGVVQDGDKYIFQEYVEITSDLRVFVVGKMALGAMRRHVVPGDVRSNASIGGRVEHVPLSADIADLAVRATEAYGYDIAGVDIIERSDGPVILEVNNAPQWIAFKKVTGINPAQEIVAHAMRRRIAAESSNN